MKKTTQTLSFSQRFEKHIFEKGMKDDELFKILNLCAEYLQMKTVKQFAKENHKSVQYIYRTEKIQKFKGVKIIFDNK